MYNSKYLSLFIDIYYNTNRHSTTYNANLSTLENTSRFPVNISESSKKKGFEKKQTATLAYYKVS